ncbi:sulfite exporter TauE/SafE family protein [Hyphomonas sp.]|uniref:sulfite exporter TauE/SafE family protein n=1 Tax=Hyphomonas sp. TaxID=87 RepID=UPI00391A5380
MLALTPAMIAAALLSGALIGLFLATFGGGGSVLAAPLLIFAVGVTDPHLAIGTSAAAVAAIALVNLAGHWRAGRVKWPCALTFAGAGFTGSLLGSTLALQVDGRWLLLGFSLAMAAIGLTMLRKPKSEGNADVHLTLRMLLRLAPAGFATGVAAGFFGIGGGFLIVPGLMMAAGMTLSNAAASSLVSVAVFGAATSANYALAGSVDLRLAGLLLAGGAVGGGAGLLVARAMATRIRTARIGFAVMIIGVAIYVAWSAAQQILG